MTNQESKANDFLPRRTFFWIMGVFVLVLSGMMGFVLAISQTFNHNVTEIKVDVAKIQVDLKLLREELMR